MRVVAQFGDGQALVAMLYFFLFFIWIWMLIAVFADIFRSHDLSGWGKALWSIFIIVLPFLGVFVYLIARGHKMGEHAAQDRQLSDAYAQTYIRNAVAASPADQVAQLAELHDKGVIDDAEFARLKSRVAS
jgi:hypothetical protein